jgi:SAM-dependent methyltransferase
MTNELTDRNFWTNYWESKKGLVQPIPANYLFHEQLRRIVINRQVKNAIELGGFPGYYTIFLKKHLGVEACLLDYFIHPGIITELCRVNEMDSREIQIIETDLFKHVPKEKYDLVLSCGLIEHFKDTKDIIQRHVQFLKPGGSLFITLPNFRGFNGWVQKTFDPGNYEKHEIGCMDPELLKKIVEDLGLEVVQSVYYGRFSTWLENWEQQNLLVKRLLKTAWFAGKVFTKIIPFESKSLSPYILIEARMP